MTGDKELLESYLEYFEPLRGRGLRGVPDSLWIPPGFGFFYRFLEHVVVQLSSLHKNYSDHVVA